MKKFYIILLSLLAFISAKSQTTYYISSSSGNDNNNGTSSSSPWKTLKSHTRGNTYKFKSGDTFYFSIPFLSNSGITRDSITSYGTGAKPVFSKFSTIKAAAWVLHSTNVWKAVINNSANVTGFIPSISNVGFLRLNHGSGTNIKGKRRATLAGINEQWEFYCDFASTIYVYSTANPSTLASSVEISNPDLAIVPSSYQGFYNIATEGCSREGFLMNHSNVSVNVFKCDIQYMGGQYKSITDSTRQAAGINIYVEGTDIWIDSCFIKQIYECAFTMQHFVASSMPYTNVRFSHNTTDSCESDVNPAPAVGTFGFVNCRIDHNLFQHAGYSWSHDIRPVDNQAGTFICDAWNTTQNDLIIENNSSVSPRECLYRKTLPPYTSRNNDITLVAGTYIYKVCPTCSQNPYPWKIEDSSAFVAATGKEVGSRWHVAGVSAQETSTYYRDADGDGFGNIAIDSIAATQPTGYVSNSGDCDDTNAAVHPGATEICDHIDNNCDGNIDEICTIYYLDADNDGWGSTDTVIRLTPPVGYVSRTGDCNNGNSLINPGATEICANGIDDNCNGQTDENCSTPTVTLSASVFYAKNKTGVAKLDVVLSKASNSTTFVYYSTVDGTAVAGTDYTSKTNAYVTVMAGSTTTQIQIPVTKMNKFTTTKYFTVVLESCADATLVDPLNATVYITK